MRVFPKEPGPFPRLAPVTHRQPADLFQELAIRAPKQFRAIAVMAQLVLKELNKDEGTDHP